MSEELVESFSGRIMKGDILVEDINAQTELEKRGYGERDDKMFILKDYEALYLLYNKKLDVRRGKKTLTFNELVRYFLSKDNVIWTRFLFYRDLRSRGYVVKEGFGFGIDFRVYDRGEFGLKPAKYIIFALNEGTETTVEEVSRSIAQMTNMGKEPIVAVIERRGELIYYKISKAKFESHITPKSISTSDESESVHSYQK